MVSSLITRPSVIFGGVLVIVLVSIVGLSLLERRLQHKIVQKKKREERFFQDKIEALENLAGDPHERLIFLDGIAREFFREAYHIPSDRQYADIIVLLRKRRKRSAVIFAEIMQEMLYGGVKIDKISVNKLSEQLTSMIDEYGTNKARRAARAERKNRKWYHKLSEKSSQKAEKITDFIEHQSLGEEIRRENVFGKSLKSQASSVESHFSNIRDSLLPQSVKKKKVKKKKETFVESFLPVSYGKKHVRKGSLGRDHPTFNFIRGIDDFSRLKEKISKKRKKLSMKNDRGEFGLV